MWGKQPVSPDTPSAAAAASVQVRNFLIPHPFLQMPGFRPRRRRTRLGQLPTALATGKLGIAASTGAVQTEAKLLGSIGMG